MNSTTPFFSTNHPYDEVLPWLKQQLGRAGLRMMQTFDLNTARLSLEDCPCPHHGTDQCNCQMVVLLIYGNEQQPVSLILHGNGGQTWLSLVDRPDQRAEEETVIAIHHALETEASAPT